MDHGLPNPRLTPAETASPRYSSGGACDSPSSHVPLVTLGDGDLPTPAQSVGSLSHVPYTDAFSLMNETEARLFRHYVQRLAVCVGDDALTGTAPS